MIRYVHVSGPGTSATVSTPAISQWTRLLQMFTASPLAVVGNTPRSGLTAGTGSVSGVGGSVAYPQFFLREGVSLSYVGRIKT